MVPAESLMRHDELSIPPHFDPAKVGEVWRVPYQERALEAEAWARQDDIRPAAEDQLRICLLPVDVQNTFCIPGFELYVGGRSGTGAVDDNRRLAEFIYRNLDVITEICPTMDTHQAIQIFHTIFLVNDRGEHPAPFTLISEEDVKQGVWKFNPLAGDSLGIDTAYGQRYLIHYAHRLKESGRYDLTLWPYHAILGGIGHALVSAIEEAIFFHGIARYSRTDFQIKGNNPRTENYSVLGPEVLQDQNGVRIAQRNAGFIQKLLQFDAVIIAGQAKSHCVAWTIDDLLQDILGRDKTLAGKVYLLEDCTSPVVVPGALDYTDEANAAFQKFAGAGIHVVRSSDPIQSWPGIR
jgi:nicotinamidase-related amidase